MNNDRSFYVTLVSNKSREFYPSNNGGEFTIQLPRALHLDGEWSVGLCDMNFPMNFLHINPGEGCITLDAALPGGITVFIPHGVYQNTESVIDALNDLKILNDHIEFKFNSQTRFTHIKKICQDTPCVYHLITLTKKLSNILGFKYAETGLLFSKKVTIHVSEKPSSLLKALPNLLYLYCDICSPYMISDKYKQVLRIVPFDTNEYKYGGNYNVNFQPYYLPIIQQSFQTISCVIKDANDDTVLFGDEPLTLTVHFLKID